MVGNQQRLDCSTHPSLSPLNTPGTFVGQHECSPAFVRPVSDKGNQRAANGNVEESPHFHKLRVALWSKGNAWCDSCDFSIAALCRRSLSAVVTKGLSENELSALMTWGRFCWRSDMVPHEFLISGDQTASFVIRGRHREWHSFKPDTGSVSPGGIQPATFRRTTA